MSIALEIGMHKSLAALLGSLSQIAPSSSQISTTGTIIVKRSEHVPKPRPNAEDTTGTRRRLAFERTLPWRCLPWCERIFQETHHD